MTMRYDICDIKFGMLQVRENEISLRQGPGGAAHLRCSAPLAEHWLHPCIYLYYLVHVYKFRLTKMARV